MLLMVQKHSYENLVLYHFLIIAQIDINLSGLFLFSIDFFKNKCYNIYVRNERGVMANG